jgi:uncharacterized membrane protein YqiK
MDDVKLAACGCSRDVSRTIMLIPILLLALMILIIALYYALLVISKRQEMMLETLLRQSGERQDTSVLINPETRSQAGRIQHGSGR